MLCKEISAFSAAMVGSLARVVMARLQTMGANLPFSRHMYYSLPGAVLASKTRRRDKHTRLAVVGLVPTLINRRREAAKNSEDATVRDVCSTTGDLIAKAAAKREFLSRTVDFSVR